MGIEEYVNNPFTPRKAGHAPLHVSKYISLKVQIACMCYNTSQLALVQVSSFKQQLMYVRSFHTNVCNSYISYAPDTWTNEGTNVHTVDY